MPVGRQLLSMSVSLMLAISCSGGNPLARGDDKGRDYIGGPVVDFDPVREVAAQAIFVAILLASFDPESLSKGWPNASDLPDSCSLASTGGVRASRTESTDTQRSWRTSGVDVRHSVVASAWPMIDVAKKGLALRCVPRQDGLFYVSGVGESESTGRLSLIRTIDHTSTIVSEIMAGGRPLKSKTVLADTSGSAKSSVDFLGESAWLGWTGEPNLANRIWLGLPANLVFSSSSQQLAISMRANWSMRVSGETGGQVRSGDAAADTVTETLLSGSISTGGSGMTVEMIRPLTHLTRRAIRIRGTIRAASEVADRYEVAIKDLILSFQDDVCSPEAGAVSILVDRKGEGSERIEVSCEAGKCSQAFVDQLEVSDLQPLPCQAVGTTSLGSMKSLKK